MNKRFWIKVSLKKPPHWRDIASNAKTWDTWDRAWRRKLGWRAGLRFWGKTNVPGSRTLLSRHWPHHLCWSWSMALTAVLMPEAPLDRILPAPVLPKPPESASIMITLVPQAVAAMRLARHRPVRICEDRCGWRQLWG